MARFDLRKSPVDHLIRKWETRLLSSLRPLEEGEVEGPVAVVTGVYRRRKDVFAELHEGR